MASIRAQADWINGYASTADKAADSLHDAAAQLTGVPIGNDAFGDLGRTLRTTDAYARASALLLQQLQRAGDALISAAEDLRHVADQHGTADDQNAKLLTRADQR